MPTRAAAALVIVLAMLSGASCTQAQPYAALYPRWDTTIGLAPDDPAAAARRRQVAALIPDIEREAREVFRTHNLPSMVVAVVVDGRLLWWRGHGRRDLQAVGPITAQTMYRIGSITKVVTAMAVLRLRDEGKLTLDAPVVAHIPALGGVIHPTKERTPITIRHLLTHTSGLPRVGKLAYTRARPEPATEEEVLAGLRGLRLKRAPGSHVHYSNLGYALLGLLVARSAQQPFRDYVNNQILQPIVCALRVGSVQTFRPRCWPPATPMIRVDTFHVTTGNWERPRRLVACTRISRVWSLC